jgi:hypothetical protein
MIPSHIQVRSCPILVEESGEDPLIGIPDKEEDGKAIQHLGVPNVMDPVFLIDETFREVQEQILHVRASAFRGPAQDGLDQSRNAFPIFPPGKKTHLQILSYILKFINKIHHVHPDLHHLP